MTEIFNDVDILLICGLPASGKSTLATTSFQDWDRVNRDDIRAFRYTMVTGKPYSNQVFDFKVEHIVTEIEDVLLRHALAQGHKLVIDNTSVSRRRRYKYVQLAQDWRKSIGCIFLDVPLEVCLERNAARRDPVPPIAIHQTHVAKQLPALDEGFDQVTVI